MLGQGQMAPHGMHPIYPMGMPYITPHGMAGMMAGPAAMGGGAGDGVAAMVERGGGIHEPEEWDDVHD